MKRITKKQAEALVKERWGGISNEDVRFVEVKPLCGEIPSHIRGDWCDYWKKVNTQNKSFLCQYGGDWFFDEPKARDFLRLLTVHLFIRHTYKD